VAEFRAFHIAAGDGGGASLAGEGSAIADVEPEATFRADE